MLSLVALLLAAGSLTSNGYACKDKEDEAECEKAADGKPPADPTAEDTVEKDKKTKE
ncbi:MAG: hypothetical protein LBJ69_01425 [Holosporales bacterium]|nr:hypothetical protein [Holosporales bacterium]